MNRSKWKATFYLCLMVLFYGLWAKSVSHIPIGTYWWDFLVFDGISEAISQGLLPARDFWSPILLPAYLFHIANLLDNDGSVYLLLHILQLAIVFPIALAIIPKRTSNLEFVLVMSVVTIFTLAPFNYSTWGGETNGNISYNCFYNRFGDLLLVLTLLMLMPSRGAKVRIEAAVAGVILSIAFVTKLSLFFILAGIVTVQLLRRKSWQNTPVLAVLCVPVTLVAGLTHLYLGPQYLNSVLNVGGIRMVQSLTLWAQRVPDFLWFHYPEILAVLLGFAAMVSVERKHNNATERMIDRGIVLFTLSVLTTLAYTMTNYGDLGLLPVSAGFLIYLKVTDRKETGTAAHAGTITDHPKPGHIGKAWLLLGTRRTVSMLGVFTLLIYLGNVGFNVYDIGKHQMAGNFVAVDTKNDYLSGRFTVHSWHLATMSGKQDILEEDEAISADIGDLVFWMYETDRASESLKNLGVGSDQKVFALTFPTYIFSRLSGFRVPVGAYPWLLAGHNISPADRNSLLLDVLDDVDIIMEDRCNLHRASRQVLPEIFRDQLGLDFISMQINSCWNAHVRK